ncbi:MAG: transglutaminase-like domain-containing protein [Oscillospiraceae bacterium]|nr:transglutaminase-like domain-containing protein [Oscillospiraceae bacterium]MCL2278896.1 transglutaminase-like domain-containing protein [Oscillospiraceae bacterium]
MTNDTTLKQYIFTIAGNSLLMFFAVLCAFGALISAFSLPVYLWRSASSWIFVCAILSAVAWRFRYKGVLISLIPAFILFLWSREEIIEGARWLIFTLTDFYSNWLVITVFFPQSAYYEGNPTTFFTAAGIFMAILLSIAICIHRSTFMTALFTIPVVLLAFVVVSADYSPSFIYLFGLLAVLLTILLTNALVFDDYRKRGIMIIPALLVAITFLGITYFVNPPERFDRTVHTAIVNRYFNEVAIRVGNLWERRPSPGRGTGWPVGVGGTGAGFMWSFNTRYVDIADSGTMNITNRSLLEVEVSAPGTFYLRGYSMQHFDGRTWSVNSSADALNYAQDEYWRNFPANIALLHSLLTSEQPSFVGMNITRTGDITNIDYIPYFNIPRTLEGLPEVVVEPLNRLNHYDVAFLPIWGSVHRLVEEIKMHLQQELMYNDEPDYDYDSVKQLLHQALGIEQIFGNAEHYLQIDESTAEALRERALNARINPNASRTEIVDAVARYIRSSATYSLTPGIVPEGEDFVLYFLQYMESGFCIHFATAATLMLRSLGVPARFTTGYVFTIPSRHVGDVGGAVTITDQNAHAWVEVFYDDVGWLYLEVTPGGAESVIPQSFPHSPSSGGDLIDIPTPPLDFDGSIMMNGDFHTDNGGLMINGIYLNGATSGEQETQAPQAAGIVGVAAAAAAVGLPTWVFNILLAVLIFMFIFITLWGRRQLVLKYRKKLFGQPDSNAAVISMWRYIEKIANREAVPPTEIEELALKARFSTHELSDEERTYVEGYAKRLADEIYRSKGDYAKVWLKYVRVLHG